MNLVFDGNSFASLGVGLTHYFFYRGSVRSHYFLLEIPRKYFKLFLPLYLTYLFMTKNYPFLVIFYSTSVCPKWVKNTLPGEIFDPELESGLKNHLGDTSEMTFSKKWKMTVFSVFCDIFPYTNPYPILTTIPRFTSLRLTNSMFPHQKRTQNDLSMTKIP